MAPPIRTRPSFHHSQSLPSGSFHKPLFLIGCGQNENHNHKKLIKLTQGSNTGLSHCKWIIYQLSHKGSPRIFKWVAYPFSRGSSQPRNQTRVSCIAGGFFTSWAIREVPIWTTALSNSVKLWAMSCRATQDRRVIVENFDKTWSTGEGNGKPLQYSCLENPMNSMKRQKDRTLKEELPRSVGAQHATGDQWRNNCRKWRDGAKAKTIPSCGCDWWWK